MLAEGTHGACIYEGTVDEVNEILEKFGTTHKVIWLGDNTHGKKPTSNHNKFKEFCKLNDLVVRCSK